MSGRLAWDRGGLCAVLGLVLSGLLGCQGQLTGTRDTGLDLLAVSRVQPALVLPGTTLVVSGRSFVDDSLGSTALHLVGTLGGEPLDLRLPAEVQSNAQLRALSTGLDGREGEFDGQATVEVDSTVDNKRYASPPLEVSLRFAATVAPTVSAIGDGVSFVNQPILASGDGFLLGGDEGLTEARLVGCFQAKGATSCAQQIDVTLPVEPEAGSLDRTRARFVYATRVSGIGPGSFIGTVTFINRQPGASERRAVPKSVRFDLQPPAILSASTTSASLGQYVVISGGGFVGAPAGMASDEATTLELKGTFTPTSKPPFPVQVILVPEWRSGPEVRYVVDEKDQLGQLVDPRHQSGTLAGTVRPVVSKGRITVAGSTIPVALTILPVKQVVHLNFQPSYVQSLRRFGLRAAEQLIQARVLAITARDFEGVNIEFRTTAPDDFALYSVVDLAGPDPNGLGLLGYDNSPGKDTDNLRLYDRIGGVNATTQSDGYPGFGGIFTESFFSFSEHPAGLAEPSGQQSPLFDAVFDPFRPDQGGQELTATELATRTPPMLTEGSSCPSKDRTQRIACAIFVLGNLIGSTLTHEVGHSLGLANPYSDGFHNLGDEANRLMDGGGDRPFSERAELEGQGPARFCTSEFDYLSQLLPSMLAPPAVSRPSCD